VAQCCVGAYVCVSVRYAITQRCEANTETEMKEWRPEHNLNHTHTRKHETHALYANVVMECVCRDSDLMELRIFKKTRPKENNRNEKEDTQ
jgi:hypothetical protein